MSAVALDGWSLLYVADPMCSWCYGFAPSLAAARSRWPGLPVTLLMGGLRPVGETLDASLRARLQQHWDEVARRSGQPFSPAGLAREGWIYRTEPACRAVVAVRERWPEQALAMFAAIQTAFYAQGRDTTEPQTLADLAQDLGIGRGAFEQAFAGSLESTQADFAAVQRLGIRGFPALAAVREGEGRIVAPGWLAPAELLGRLEQVFGA